jgi:outer membrane protein assembly factor BamB
MVPVAQVGSRDLINWKPRVGVALSTLLFEGVLVALIALGGLAFVFLAFQEGWTSTVERHADLMVGTACATATLFGLAAPWLAVRLVSMLQRSGAPPSAGGAVVGTFIGFLPGLAAALALRHLTLSFANDELLHWADWYLVAGRRHVLLITAVACTLACASLGSFVGSGSQWRPTRRSLPLLICCLAATTGTVAPASLRLAEWMATSRIALPVPLGPPPPPLWSRRVPGAHLFPSEPLAGVPPPSIVRDASGRLYFAAPEALVALDSQGTLVWEFRPRSFDPRIGQPVLLPQGLVAIGTREGLLAFDRDGRPAWAVAGEAAAGPVALFGASRNLVYAAFPRSDPQPGQDSLIVRALDASNGTERWSVGVSTATISVALDATGRTYLADDHLRVFDASGVLAWRYPAGGRVQLAPDGSVYVSGRGGLVALTASGDEAWTIRTARSDEPFFPLCAESGIALDGDAIYFTCSGRLFSYGRDGRERWHRRLAGSLTSHVSRPVVGPDGTVYLAGRSLWAITPKGDVIWRQRLVGEPGHGLATLQPASSAPVPAPDGSVWIGCGDGRVMVFESDGRLRWEYRPGPGEPFVGPVTGFSWVNDDVVAESGTLRAFPGTGAAPTAMEPERPALSQHQGTGVSVSRGHDRSCPQSRHAYVRCASRRCGARDPQPHRRPGVPRVWRCERDDRRDRPAPQRRVALGFAARINENDLRGLREDSAG